MYKYKWFTLEGGQNQSFPKRLLHPKYQAWEAQKGGRRPAYYY